MRKPLMARGRLPWRRTKWGKTIEPLLEALAYLAPALVILIIFVFYPLVHSFYLSLFETNLMGEPIFFNGIEHYKNLLSSSRFWASLRTTLWFTIYTVPIALILAIPVALLGNLEIKGITFYRTIFISTIAVSTAIASVIWTWMFFPTTGVINDLLRMMGLPAMRWLQDPAIALIAVSIATVWKGLGLNVLFLLAGLQGIPEELVDAARIDGANNWHVFWSISLPILSPTIFFLLVVGTIDAFRSFAQVHIMTQGGPLRSTTILVYSIYRDAFINFNFGFASAQAVTLFLIILALTLIQFRYVERGVYYQ